MYFFKEIRKWTPDSGRFYGFLRSLPAFSLFAVFFLAFCIYVSADTGTMMASDITREQFVAAVAKVQETARKKGYVYGDSRSAVPTQDGKISCDRLIAKALYDLGFRDQETGGITVGSMPSYLNAHGFIDSTSFNDIGYGSIVLIKHYGHSYFDHTFVTLSFDPSTLIFDSYDCGSNGYIRSVQPIRNKDWRAHTTWRTDSILVFNIPEVLSLDIDLDDALMVTGQDFQIAATVKPDSAASAPLEWTSMNPAVAVVSGSGSTGTVKTLAPGETEIVVKVKDSDIEKRCKLVVLEIPVTKVKLKSKSSSVGIGFASKLDATVYPADATHPQITWSSLNPNIASVSSDGTVTGHKTGTATIVAQAGTKVAKCTVKVKRFHVESISLNKKKLRLKVGKSKLLKVRFNPVYAANQKVIWKSSDPSVARVKKGLVTARKKGTATITVISRDGKKKAACKVTVR